MWVSALAMKLKQRNRKLLGRVNECCRLVSISRDGQEIEREGLVGENME